MSTLNSRNKRYKIAIIGGGAGGLASAVSACENISGKDIIILERQARTGKKILASGNGRGNISNKSLSVKNYYSENPDFMKYALENVNIEDFFYKLGGIIYEEEGRLYLNSQQSSSVVDLLRNYILENGVTEKTSFEVTGIKKQGGLFIISGRNNSTLIERGGGAADGEFQAENIIFCCGGCSYKGLSAGVNPYKLLIDLGHKLIKPYPALVQLKTDMQYTKNLNGVRNYVNIRLFDKDKYIKDFEGELQFTAYGISGIASLNLSVAAQRIENPEIFIDFFPSYSQAQLEKIFNDKLANIKNLKAEQLFTGIINKQTGISVLKRANINLNGGISRNDICAIVNVCKNFRLKITGNLGFDYAQVTGGGIDTSDVDCKTMESKIIKNLYICGEALDVTGVCGGYNLHFAFAGGIIAGTAIK